MTDVSLAVSNKKDFIEWRSGVTRDISHVQGLLMDELSDNPNELVRQLAEIEAWHGRMTTLLATATTYLDLAEQAALMGRDEDWTDLDRKIELKARTALERFVRDEIDGLVESIRTRLILGMSLNKMNHGEKLADRYQT